MSGYGGEPPYLQNCDVNVAAHHINVTAESGIWWFPTIFDGVVGYGDWPPYQ
jgi:hypothetical protein